MSKESPVTLLMRLKGYVLSCIHITRGCCQEHVYLPSIIYPPFWDPLFVESVIHQSYQLFLPILYLMGSVVIALFNWSVHPLFNLLLRLKISPGRLVEILHEVRGQ